MTNETYPESVIGPGLWESYQWDWFVYGLGESYQTDWVDPEQNATTPKYTLYEITEIAAGALYLFGFFSNMSILLVFFKVGFSSSTNISFFFLAVADLTICVIYSALLISKVLQPICRLCIKFSALSHDLKNVEQLPTAMTTWITVILCWERLCCIAYPIKVSLAFHLFHNYRRTHIFSGDLFVWLVS